MVYTWCGFECQLVNSQENIDEQARFRLVSFMQTSATGFYLLGVRVAVVDVVKVTWAITVILFYILVRA